MKKTNLYRCSITLMAAIGTISAERPDLGINLSWPVDWNQQHIFADLMKTAGGWEELTTNDPVPVDSQGWPTADGRCSMWFTDHMHGTYKLHFETRVDNNNVAISATLIGSSTDPVVSNIVHPAPNRTTADIVITDSTTRLFTISFSNTNGGLKYVKLLRPISPGNATSYGTEAMLTDQFKQAMAPFSTIRYMQTTATNFSRQHVWSDRAAPDLASFNHNSADVGGRGISWECVIQTANDLHKDAWIDVPLWVDENYLRQLAILSRDGNSFTDNKGLDPDLHLYVELSNEIWNYEQNENRDTAIHEVLNHGDPDNLNYDHLTQEEASDGWEWGWRRPGAGIVRISTIFREVFGDAAMMTRIRPLLCWQAPRHATAWAPLVYIEKTKPQPVNYYVYGGGGSAYYSPDLGQPGLTLDGIWSNRSMDTSWWRDTWPDGLDKFSMKFNALICNVYGIKRIAYEGGPSFDPNQPGKNDSIMNLAWSDARMRNEIVEHHDAWNNWGGDLLVYYVLNQGGFSWDFVESVFDLSAPKYQGILDLDAASPSPITVGHSVGTTIDGNAFQLGNGDWRDTLGTGTAWRHENAWVSYQYNVPTAGSASVVVNLTTPGGSSCHVDIWMDGRSVFVDTVPQDVTQDVTTDAFSLSAGLHSLRVNADVEGWVVKSVKFTFTPAAVRSLPDRRRDFTLLQNYPNPFAASTAIRYEVKTAGTIDVRVFDLSGREMATLVDGVKAAGVYTVIWNGKNASGRTVGSGVYYYRFTSNNGGGCTKKMIFRGSAIR